MFFAVDKRTINEESSASSRAKGVSSDADRTETIWPSSSLLTFHWMNGGEHHCENKSTRISYAYNHVVQLLTHTRCT